MPGEGPPDGEIRPFEDHVQLMRGLDPELVDDEDSEGPCLKVTAIRGAFWPQNGFSCDRDDCTPGGPREALQRRWRQGHINETRVGHVGVGILRAIEVGYERGGLPVVGCCDVRHDPKWQGTLYNPAHSEIIAWLGSREQRARGEPLRRMARKPDKLKDDLRQQLAVRFEICPGTFQPDER